MTTYLLEGIASARLPRRPLAVTLSLQGNPGAVRLAARLENSAQNPSVLRHSATMLIVPRVDEELIIFAVPDNGRERFDANTSLHVSIGLDSAGDPDSDVAQLAPRDVSGLTAIDLASIAPAGADQVVVTTRLIQSDAALPPLAARARVACRGVLGVDRLPPGQQSTVTCLLDPSASIAARVGDGTVGAAIDIITGIGAVLSGPTPVTVSLADDRLSTVDYAPPAELGAKIRAALTAAGYGVGADLQAAVDAVDPAVGLVVVITAGAGPALRRANGAALAHLVLSGSRAAVEQPGFVGALCPPDPLGDIGALLTGTPQALDALVAGLVAPVLATR